MLICAKIEYASNIYIDAIMNYQSMKDNIYRFVYTILTLLKMIYREKNNLIC